MAAVPMPEKVIDPLLFHQTGSEAKIAFAVLRAVFPRLERALNLVGDIESRQHLLEDIGHGKVLKNAALAAAREQPELRHHFHAVRGERLITGALADAADDAGHVARFAAGADGGGG